MSGPFDLARILVRRGHQVTIFASGFSHYRFIELRLQRGEWIRGETIDGVQFVWLRTFPYSQNNWRRVFNMVSYALLAALAGMRMTEKPDIVIGVTVHPLAAVAAYFVSRVRKCGFLLEVRDLWPLALIELKRVSEKSLAAKTLRLLEGFLYRRAKKIIVLWPKMGSYIEGYGVPPSNCVWIPHGINLARYADLEPYEGRARRPFQVFYLGGYVDQFALDVILKAARVLEDQKVQDLRFVMVGGGQEKARIVQQAANLGLSIVEFRDVVPRDEVVRVMNEADAFILCIRDLPGLYRYGVSFNKLTDYLISGRPVLFSGAPGFNPVKEAQAGLVVPPEDPCALAEAVKELVGMPPEKRASMGRNGSKYARENFDVEVLATRYEAVLRSSWAGAGRGEDPPVGESLRRRASG